MEAWLTHGSLTGVPIMATTEPRPSVLAGDNNLVPKIGRRRTTLPRSGKIGGHRFVETWRFSNYRNVSGRDHLILSVAVGTYISKVPY